MTAITPHESSRLEALESVIKQGRDSFLAVGMALAQINRDRLYRADHSSFEEYLEKRWAISKSHGYRLIAFAKDAETSPTGDTPKNEFQSRKTREKSYAQVTSNAAGDGSANEYTVNPCAGLNGNSETGGVNLTEPAPPHSTSTDFVAACGNPVLPEMVIEPATIEYYSRFEELTDEAIREGNIKQLRSAAVGLPVFLNKLKQQIRLLESKKTHSSPILSASSPKAEVLAMGS
jgi:hypothetical protein